MQGSQVHSFGGAVCISCRALEKSSYDVALPSPISNVSAHILADLRQGCYMDLLLSLVQFESRHILYVYGSLQSNTSGRATSVSREA